MIFNNSWPLFSYSLMNVCSLSLKSVLKAPSLGASSSLHSLSLCWSAAVRLLSLIFSSSSNCVSLHLRSSLSYLSLPLISYLISFSMISRSWLLLSLLLALLFPLLSVLRGGDVVSSIGESTGCSEGSSNSPLYILLLSFSGCLVTGTGFLCCFYILLLFLILSTSLPSTGALRVTGEAFRLFSSSSATFTPPMIKKRAIKVG